MRSLFEHLQGVRNEAPFGAWVRRIAVNRCFMPWRSPWQHGRAQARLEAARQRLQQAAQEIAQRSLRRGRDEHTRILILQSIDGREPNSSSHATGIIGSNQAVRRAAIFLKLSRCSAPIFPMTCRRS